MSYCRIGEDSDVYIIHSDVYEITLTGGTHFTRDTASEALSVLEILDKLGYKVPKRAITRLQNELAVK